MKTLIALFALPWLAFAQYQAVPATQYPALEAILNAKPAVTSGSGVPTANCTPFLDIYLRSNNHLYFCTGAPNTWTDYTPIGGLADPGSNGLLKRTSLNVTAAAVAGTDYAPATSGAVPLKGSGSGGFSAAAYADLVALWASGSCSGFLKSDGTCGASSGLADPGSNGLLKRTSLNVTAAAVAGTDYAPATSGGVPLKGSGSGGFSAAGFADLVALWASGSCAGYLKNDGTCSTAGGVADPGSNGIMKRTSLNVTAAAVVGTDYAAATSGSVPLKGNGSGGFSAAGFADVVTLWGSCAGYLKNDGTCSTAGGVADPGSNGIMKRTSLNVTAAAVAGTDYAAATSGSAPLKGNGSGGFSAAAYADLVALWASGSCSGFLKSDGTCGASSGLADPGSNGLLKRTSLNVTAAAVAGTDYAAATSGSVPLKGNGSGGFSAAGFADLVTLWASGSCAGYLKNDGTCGGASGAGAAHAVQTTDGSGNLTDSGCTATSGALTCPGGVLTGTGPALFTGLHGATTDCGSVPSNEDCLFFDSANSDHASRKDSGGTVHDLEASSGPAACTTCILWPFGNLTYSGVNGYWPAQAVRADLFSQPFGMVVSKLDIFIGAALGSSCTGGTCGVQFAIYNAAGTSLLASTTPYTTAGTSDATVSLSLTSPVTLTGGTSYFLASCTDSAALTVASDNYVSTLESSFRNTNATRSGTAANAYSADGASIACPATLGAITGNGDPLYLVMFE